MQSRDILKVSELNQKARALLETQFPILWVEGEISNLARPASGHLYFSLKDAQAQVRCAMFRYRAQLNTCQPKNGLQVIVRARVSLYEGRGEFQLIVEHIQAAGEGLLQQRFAALKQRLLAEGLFEAVGKRPLPLLAQGIAIITSASGAAIHDVLSVLQRRFPAIPVYIYPVAVQGENAAGEIISALKKANASSLNDVILLTRGGGSLEDLWPFNDERLARTIASSRLPVVSAIGHETDFSISDFVADARAPTPSAAAELLSPDVSVWLDSFIRIEQNLIRQLKNKIQFLQQKQALLSARVQHPQSRLNDFSQRLDNFELRLHHAIHKTLQQNQYRLARQAQHLLDLQPAQQLESLSKQLDYLQARLLREIKQHLQTHQQAAANLGKRLDTVSPLATLQRGYSIVTDARAKKVLHRIEMIKTGQKLQIKFVDGVARCVVESKQIDEAST
ncbi:exodeoxyribonuclease VII large subunit [Candidatus Venteria ishoeyi]|uniref:exodeoxyribonuclease VII large subunit n=1 Tax=Candidatus Venteria ishoeyi TaxID=1899563 RepID=UPI0025A4D972|nr:exodeoxyribonuclease VII large subunit [Candidatus Venteria ishoeyi]MDM8547380.1 exodeoxyribonuclease VII large subunit [Candidatus Venteria ishoeyi]